MNQKTVGLTLRATILALALILVAGSLPLLPLDGVAYAQTGPTLTAVVAPDNSRVSLTWNAVGGATDYEVYRQEQGGTWGDAIAVSALTYTDSDVTAGTSYFYIVHAVGSTDWSNTPKVTVGGGTAKPTTKPTLNAAAEGLTAITLTWNTISAADHYDMRRWNSDTNAWDRIGGDLNGNSYTDDNLDSGLQYWYILRAVNAGGNGPWSSSDGAGYATVTLASATIVPELSLEHTSREKVVLTWTAVTEAGAQYELQRMTAVTGTATGVEDVTWARLPDNALSGTTYTDSEAVFVNNSTSTTYRYRVYAVIDGEQGDYSNTVSVQIPASGVRPPAPTISSASATSSTTIVVSWSQVPVATSYELQYKTGDGAYSSPITIRITSSNAAAPSYTHRGRSAGTKYTYQVRSKNVNGDSDWSAAVSRDTPAAPSTGGQRLDTPRSLNAADDSDEAGPNLKVSWGSVTDANGYQLLQWDTDTNMWVPVPFGDDTATTVAEKSFTIPSLMPATTYHFVVRAIEFRLSDPEDNTSLTEMEDDTSEWSAPFSGTTRSHKPSVPTGLDVTPRTESTIWLSWEHGDGDVESEPPTGDPTSYTIEWRRGLSGSRGTINVEGRKTRLHMNLSPDKDYYYRVRANNAGGSSQWYPNPNHGTVVEQMGIESCIDPVIEDVAGCEVIEIKGTTSARALMPPANISPEAVTNVSIKLSWDKVTGAIGYEIQRWDGNAWVMLDADGETDTGNGLVPEGTTTFTHKNIGGDNNAPAAGMHHTEYYVMRTVSQGGVVSTWSGLVVGTTEPTMPTTAPTLTLVPSGQTSVRLTWSAVPGATGYKVEYFEGALTAADVGGFGDKNIQRMSFSEGASPTYKTHTDLKVGTRYSYRVTAMLANEVMSNPSDVEQIVTKPATPALSGSATTATSVELTFPQIMLDGDHLGVLTDYEIQRRKAGELWVAINVGLMLVAETCETGNEVACKFTHSTSVEAGTTYFYRIRVAKTDLVPDVSDNAPGNDDPLTSYWRQIRVRTPNASS